jgi:ribonucleoside-diphosphate reductase alpha chain
VTGHPAPPDEPTRHRLPELRRGKTRHTEILSHKERQPGVVETVRTDIYLTANVYPDGSPGEVFCDIDQSGSRVGALVDAWCTAVSIGLQCGVPLEVFLAKAVGAAYEPSGRTTDPDLPVARSPLDYLARRLGLWFDIDLGPAPRL